MDSAVIEALPVIPEPETLPETEERSDPPITTETVGEPETQEITEKAPDKGGCSGNIFSSITLLVLAFAVAPAAVKRKKENE